jgi:hypothetical protein
MPGAPEPVPNLVGGFDIVFDDQHTHLSYSPLGSQNRRIGANRSLILHR